MKNVRSVWILVAFPALICLLCSFLAYARDNGEGKSLRVAVYNNSPLAYLDKEGVWRGSDIECLLNIAQRAGFGIEFIDSANDPDFLGNLDKGLYDIVADVVRTPEREQKYLFSDDVLGTVVTTLAVRAGDDRWEYGNLGQISRMKIGILSTYANNAAFRTWCTNRGVTPCIVEYASIKEMTRALDDGEIDGEVYGTMYGKEYTQKYRTILRFLPQSYYFAFRKSDGWIKNAVDEAMAQITVGNLDYLASLNNKYRYQFQWDILPLSSSEKKYVADHPVATVAVVRDDEPYYAKDASGRERGIIPDYYAAISAYCSLQFRFVSYASQEEAIRAVTDGQADILGLFDGGIISASRQGLAPTNSFFAIVSVLLTKAGKTVSGTDSIAVRQDELGALNGALLGDFSRIQMKGYPGTGECLRAMERGEADAALLGLPSATWLLNQTNASAYSITPLPGVRLDLCGAVKVQNRVLCSILNKSIAVTRGSFNGIITQNTVPAAGLENVISRIPPYAVALIISILLTLVLGLVWSLALLVRRQRERNAVLMAKAETDRQRIQIEALQKNAEERNRFFSNISHDMRTPLNAVSGFIDLAQNEELLPEQRKAYLAKAEFSCSLLLDLINDTLTISKISSGKMELHPQPCRLTELLETVASPIRDAAEKKHITFSVDVSDTPGTGIIADTLNVQKILLNLLSNAVKFTPEGGHIWYSAAQESEENGRIRYSIIIRDDGIGMSEDFLPHVFDPFSQEGRQGYESIGTGLGLSIVRQLVGMMGGTIAVRSEKDRGTEFTLHLAFEKAVMPSGELRQAPAAPADLSGKKILLCEDNELNREIAVTLLKNRGLEIVTAVNGQDGVRIFSESAPGEYAAILMDIRMPVMDGFEAAGHIRAMNRPDAKKVPIIAMTADAFDDDIKKCLDAGMDDHVAKPISPEKLLRKLAAHIMPD